MNRFMTSRRLEALTHGWQDINKIFGRLNVLPCALPRGVGEENKQTRATEVSAHKDVWSSWMASPAFKMLNPNSGRKQVPIQFRSDTRIASQCPVLFIHFSLLLLPVFPLFVLRKPVGPWHTLSTTTPQIPQEQLLQTSNSWESNTLESGYSCGLLPRGKLIFPNRGCSFFGLRYF